MSNHVCKDNEATGMVGAFNACYCTICNKVSAVFDNPSPSLIKQSQAAQYLQTVDKGLIVDERV